MSKINKNTIEEVYYTSEESRKLFSYEKRGYNVGMLVGLFSIITMAIATIILKSGIFGVVTLLGGIAIGSCCMHLGGKIGRKIAKNAIIKKRNEKQKQMSLQKEIEKNKETTKTYFKENVIENRANSKTEVHNINSVKDKTQELYKIIYNIEARNK